MNLLASADAIIISDLHLGSDNCQARILCYFLEDIQALPVPPLRLILNGDVFDSLDFRRLKKNHWKVLSLLRKLSDKMEIIWICGNHDGLAEVVSHLLGVTVKEEYVLTSGEERILVLHGHVFDDFLDAHPIITWFADLVYGLLQWIDRTHYFAKLAKKGSKVFLRCAQTIQEKATAYAQRRQCTGVCCGHTHHAVQAEGHGVAYFNSGCWTEKPGTFLTILNGKVDLGTYYSPAEIPQEIASSPSFVHLLRTYKEPENNLEKLG